MKAKSFILIIFVLSLFILSGCKGNGDDSENIVPVYLEDFTEYTPTKPYTATDIKGYVENYGLTELAAVVKYDVKVYKIKYKTAFEGDSITVSGLLAAPVPKGKNDAFPMLSYQHGTITTKAESPTSNPQGEITALATYMASTGFVVIIPDYIGFGSSSDKFHPYMIKQYTVNAILDFIRASKEFIATEKPCKINSKLFLSGYSQGGSATLAALSAIENISANSDLKVTASACGAGIYDLNTFRNWMVSQVKYDQPYFMAYLLESFKRYANLNISDTLIFSKEIIPRIEGMFDGVRTSDEMNAMFKTLHVGELFYDDFEKDSTSFNKDEKYTELRAAFTENSVPAWSLNSNVTLYYGKDDMVVPNEQSLKIYSEFRTKGATSKIRIDAMDGLDHNEATIPTLSNSVIWFKTF
jgi:dienelactone hydrolase